MLRGSWKIFCVTSLEPKTGSIESIKSSQVKSSQFYNSFENGVHVLTIFFSNLPKLIFIHRTLKKFNKKCFLPNYARRVHTYTYTLFMLVNFRVAVELMYSKLDQPEKLLLCSKSY